MQSGSNRDRYSLGIYLNIDGLNGAALSASVCDVCENDSARSAIAMRRRAAEKGVSVATKETPLNPPREGFSSSLGNPDPTLKT